MKTIYFHCGPHKTGSTSIQDTIRDRPDLMAERGLLVPKFSTKISLTRSHFLLYKEIPAFLRQDFQKAPRWWLLRKIFRDTEMTPVITAEDFCIPFMRPDVIDALAQFCTRYGYRAHLIYYLRDQPGWINSTYVHEARKLFHTDDFAAHLPKAYKRNRFDFETLLGAALEHPDVDVTAIPFAAAASTGLFNSLLEAVGAEPTRVKVPRSNPNAGIKSVYAGVQLARLLDHHGLKARGKRELENVLRGEASRRRWYREPFMGLDDTLAEQIRARYAASNDRIARRLWGRSWAEVSPPKAGFTPNILDPARCRKSDLADVEEVIDKVKVLIDLIVAARKDAGRTST